MAMVYILMVIPSTIWAKTYPLMAMVYILMVIPSTIWAKTYTLTAIAMVIRTYSEKHQLLDYQDNHRRI